MRIRLTETAIRKHAREAAEGATRIELADATLPGLRLRLSPGGAATWLLGMRDREGRARRFTLGEFPTLGIADARERARDARQAIRHDGIDPIAQRRQERAQGAAAARGEGTLRAVLDAYGEAVGGALRSWAPGRPRIERVFRDLLAEPTAKLTVAGLLLAADGYPSKASAAFAVRTLRPVLKWAALRELVPAAVALIQRRDEVRRRDRVLSRDELQLVLPVLRASPRPHAAALRFMLLTLGRREEVCSARWAEVDLAAGTWTIPAGRSKNRQVHVVPLSRQARELLAAVRQAELARQARAAAPAGVSAPGIAPAGLVFRTGTGGRLGSWDRETRAIHHASGTTGWHRHDLRRTGATMLGEMGELPDIIEAALNHVSIRSPLAATYNRSRYRPQVAAALQRLADALDGIEAGAAEVVPIGRAVA